MSTTIKTTNEIVREVIDEASEVARSHFRDAVKPIYGVTDKGAPEHIGSALLLALPEGKFILTAAHVIDWHATTTLYLGAGTFLPLQLEAYVTAAPDGVRKDDHIDFAFGRLAPDALANLSGVKFITEADISRSVSPPDGRMYTCLGYPNSRNKVSPGRGTAVTPSLFPYTGLGRTAAKLPKIAKDNVHILVDYDSKRARDESGAVVSPVALEGCSGGAIIDSGRISLETLGDKLKPKIAGLVIERHTQEKVILGTRLSVIVDAIRSQLKIEADAAASSLAKCSSP